VRFAELKNNLKEKKSRIYLLEGSELYFIDKGAEMIKSSCLSYPELNYSTFSGQDIKADPKGFLASVYAYPFMSELRVVRVNDFYPTEKEYEKVKEAFENPSEFTLLMIVNTGKGGASYTGLKKKPNVAFVDCSKAESEDVVKWIYLTLRKAGINADTSLCSDIASYCSENMARVASETEKLIAYKRSGGEITRESVDEIVYKDTDYKLYELTGAAAKKNYTLFSSIMNELLQRGHDEAEFLSALGGYYKTLYDCAVSPYSDEETGKILGIKPYAVKMNRRMGVDKKKTKELYSYIFSSSADIRTGKLSAAAALGCVTAKIFFG